VKGFTDMLFSDRGAFWTGKYAYSYFWIPFYRLTRLLLDYFMHTRIMYHALHASGHTDRYIIQDLALPAGNAGAFTQYVDATFGLYPLWLCPLRKDARESMGHPRAYHGTVAGAKNVSEDGYQGLYINVGVWGPYPSSQDEYVRANRELEAKVRELGGLKGKLLVHALGFLLVLVLLVSCKTFTNGHVVNKTPFYLACALLHWLSY